MKPTKRKNNRMAGFLLVPILALFSAFSHAGFIAQTDTYDVEDFQNSFVLGAFQAPPFTGLEKVIVSWDLTLWSDWSASSCLTFQDCEPGNLTWDLTIGNIVPDRQFSETSPDNGITNDTDDPQSGISDLYWQGMTIYTAADLAAFVTGGTLDFDLDYVDNGFGLSFVYDPVGTVSIAYVVPVPATLALLLLGAAGIGYRQLKTGETA